MNESPNKFVPHLPSTEVLMNQLLPRSLLFQTVSCCLSQITASVGVLISSQPSNLQSPNAHDARD